MDAANWASTGLCIVPDFIEVVLFLFFVGLFLFFEEIGTELGESQLHGAHAAVVTEGLVGIGTTIFLLATAGRALVGSALGSGGGVVETTQRVLRTQQPVLRRLP